MTDIPKPRFDPTINLGHIISMVLFIAALTGGWYLTDYRLSQLEFQVKNLSSIIVDNARLDERLKDIGRRVDRLEAIR